MELIYRTKVEINDSFRDFLKHQNYEDIVFIMLKRSRKLFSNKRFSKIEGQSCKESDFIDSDGNKYEAKLLIDTIQGALIGDRKNDIVDWLQSMLDESSEYARLIMKRDVSGIEITKLYKIMKTQIEKLEKDENGILFIPYPVVYDIPDSYVSQFATDYLQACYNRLKEQGLIGNRKVFFIYPGIEKDIYILRNDGYLREFIEMPEIGEYISFNTTMHWL